MRPLAILVEDQEVERRVREAVGEDDFRRSVAVVRPRSDVTPEVTAKELAAAAIDLVLVGPPVEPADALRIAEMIDRDHPEITVVLIATPSPSLWEQAVRAGVRDILTPGARPPAYRAVIDHALHAAEVRRSNIIDINDDGGRHEGRIITVLSPKGGAGKTTIATNLAVGLAMLAPDDVALVDLDLQFGDVASAMQLLPELSLADLAPGEAQQDPSKVKLLLTHHPDGLFALCAPDDPAAADNISADDIGPVLHAVAADLRYVIVDTSAGIDSQTLAAIEVSSDLVLVGAMDVPSVRSLRKLIDALDRMGLTKAERLVVLNRSDSRVDLDVDDIAAAIGLPIAVSIPSSRSVPLSINHGCPVLVFDPRSPVVYPLRELVSRLSGEPLPASGSHSLFRRSIR
ncbi:MAG TPA: AAA family ATPase [Acidimicrobiales bacterium]|nr:AAA family ATPase [Acidimicrobiales bacterium]